MVREALLWYGETDPVKTTEEIKEEDPQKEELLSVLTELKRVYGNATFSTKELLKEQKQGELFEALRGVAPSRSGESIDGKRLGAWFGYKKDVLVGGLKLIKVGETNHATWKVGGSLSEAAKEPDVLPLAEKEIFF